MLVAPPPATPLRVLCLVALDALHAARHSRALPRARREALAALLDLQAAANAEWDGKPCPSATARSRPRADDAELISWLAAYRDDAGAIEARRPAPGGDPRRFAEVRDYREAIVRVALAAVAGMALGARDLGESLRATHEDGDLAVLFRLAMQCQVLDDVLDYRQDLAAGLPSLLTACTSLADGLASTGAAARSYGACRGTPAHGALPPLRLALRVLTAAAVLATAARTAVRSRPARARRSSAPACPRAATRWRSARPVPRGARPGCRRSASGDS
jgi:hypothetical protein